MGSRIGYCVVSNGERSPIFRMQWKTSIEELVKDTWKMLLTRRKYNWEKSNPFEGYEQGKINDGDVAIRDDLDQGRAFAAMVRVGYEPPFHSIQSSIWCDINDNGLIEVDVTNYKKWTIRHIDIHYKKDGDKEGKITRIATMSEDGFKWLISQDTKDNLGEGLT